MVKVHKKIDASPSTKVRGLIDARFLDASKLPTRAICCTETCNCEQVSCDRSADHTLKDVVLGRHYRHNKKYKILNFLLSNKNKEFTIRAISKNTSVDYKTTYLIVNGLINQKVIISKRAGQSILCSISQKVFNGDIFKTEEIRRKELLENKDFSVLQSYFNEIKDPFFILLLFGSYASGKQKIGSDIDLMLITNNEDVKKQVKSKTSLIPLKIHLLDFNSEEILSMLKTTEFNVGKEAFNNNIILFGIEDYYRLIKSV